jgi:hypothetical protein
LDLQVTQVVATLQFDTPSSIWLVVFPVLGVISLGFSLVLLVKSQAMRKIPKSLTTTIFSRTFNVFDPFSEHRSVRFQSDFFFILTGLSVTSLVLVACVEILVSGLLVEFATFFLCLGLMMIGEATETYSTANSLVKAVKRQTSFGQGDIYVLLIVKKTIRRLSVYYILLSVLFATLFFTMPYMFPALMLGFSQFIGLILITSATIGIALIGPFVAALLFALFTVAVFRTAGRMKAAFFGFLPSDIFQTDEIMARWILHERA